MGKIFLIEASATRRRAVAGMLQTRGFELAIIAGYAEALASLSALDRLTIKAIIVSWPDYSDHRADDVFALLRSRDWQSVPVLVLADSTDAGAVNWLMKRPSTALLLWSDYSETPDALAKLIAPPRSAETSVNVAVREQLSVLFVDDSPTVRVAFRRLLQAENFAVETASSAEEGLDRALAGEFDIAIIDYFMPGDNGAGLVRKLKENKKTRAMPCAIITGTYSDRVITESLAAGAVECMFKSEARELFLARMKSLSRTIWDRKAIDNERRRLHGILNSVGDGVYGVDIDGVIQFVNPAALVMLGFPHMSALVGKRAREVLHSAFEDGTKIPSSACFLSQCYRESNQVAGWQTVFWSESKKPVPVECTVYPLDIDGKREGSVVAFRDVSQRRVLEDELRWQASHDSLTKLNNRAYFELQLQQEVARLKRSEQVSLLLFIDCDRFKYINDTAGHAAGDQLLIDFSHRLKARLRVSDSLARMGGDEYALILRNIAGSDEQRLAEEFLRALSTKPFVYGEKSYWITVSIGVARVDQFTASQTEAMQNADIACHVAKNRGRNQVYVYSADSKERDSMDVELNWSTRLEEALKHDRFRLVFQPVIAIAHCDEVSVSGSVWESARVAAPKTRMFFEALLRMQGSDGELIVPNAFLPTAERYNLMLQIDRWVIHNAFKALKEQQNSEQPIGLSINLSAQSLSEHSIVQYVQGKMIEFDIEPRAVNFEITETRALNNLDAAKTLISELRALGFRFALDDFGSGFSSFTHLKDLDVDFLKIDGAFTQGILNGTVERAVVKAITSIAHSVGKKTIAECVDRPELVEALRAAGVDYLQGYYVGMPAQRLRVDISSQNLDAGSSSTFVPWYAPIAVSDLQPENNLQPASDQDSQLNWTPSAQDDVDLWVQTIEADPFLSVAAVQVTEPLLNAELIAQVPIANVSSINRLAS